MFVIGGAIIFKIFIIRKTKYIPSMKFKKLLVILLYFLFSTQLTADEKKIDTKNTEFNVYTGMFDFSDDGKKSALLGFQHQDENLNRDTFSWKFVTNQWSNDNR